SNIHGISPKRISLALGLRSAWNLPNWAGVNSVTASLPSWLAGFDPALACAWGGFSASAGCMRKLVPVNTRQAGSSSAAVFNLVKNMVFNTPVPRAGIMARENAQVGAGIHHLKAPTASR